MPGIGKFNTCKRCGKSFKRGDERILITEEIVGRFSRETVAHYHKKCFKEMEKNDEI